MRVTIKDIAKICNVSTATVSRTVNGKKNGVGEKTRKHILETIKKTGYTPNTIARSMVTKRTNTIALIIPDICNPFFAELAKGVDDICYELGYHLFLCNTDSSSKHENEHIAVLRERLVDGIIMTTQNIEEDNTIIIKLIKEEYPFVLIERYIPGLNIPIQITIDNEGGIKKAVSYLVKKGHRRIAFIRGPREAINAEMRFNGYKEALDEHGLRYDSGLVVTGDYQIQSGYSSMSKLLRKNKGAFTALVGSNDLMTAGACSAIFDQGLRIPQDISVVGFDNIPLTGMIYPRITSVGVYINKLGRMAAELLYNRISGDKENKQVFIPCELTERNSVRSL